MTNPLNITEASASVQLSSLNTDCPLDYSAIPELYLYPEDGGSRLVWSLGAAKLELELNGRLTLVLLLLYKAFEQDKTLPPELRGFRSGKTLATAYSEHPSRWAQVEAIRSYLCKLNGGIKEKGKEHHIPMLEAKLLERKPRLGARLLRTLRVIPIGQSEPTPLDQELSVL